MKEQLLTIVYDMYVHLERQYQSHLNLGNGREVHALNTGRTPLCGNIQLMDDAFKKKNLPKEYTYERIGDLLQLYDRKESELVRILDKRRK